MIVIVVINWNGIEDTLECMDSILKSNYEDYLVYLIDNGSDNFNKNKLIESFGSHSKIRLRLYDENHGFTRGHNKIYNEELKQIDFDWLLLLNNDTSIDQECLTNLMNFVDDNDYDIASAKMINYYHRKLIDNVGHKLISTGEIVPIGSNESITHFTSKFQNIGACGGAGFYKKECIEKLDFFDEYFDTGYEDAELGLRATMVGYRSGFCPDAIVYHKGGNSIKKVFDENYAIKSQKNILYSLTKLYPLPLLILYYPINLIRTLLIIILCIIILRWNISKILIVANINFLRKDLKLALNARKLFFNHRKRIPWYKLVKDFNSFISYDLKRAYNYLIKRSPSALDKYR